MPPRAMTSLLHWGPCPTHPRGQRFGFSAIRYWELDNILLRKCYSDVHVVVKAAYRASKTRTPELDLRTIRRHIQERVLKVAERLPQYRKLWREAVLEYLGIDLDE